MIRELRDLTARQRRGRQLTRADLTTRVSPTPGPHSEFKMFLVPDTRRQSASTTKWVNESRRSVERHAATDSGREDSDSDLADELDSLAIRSRHESPLSQPLGAASESAGRSSAQQSARHSIDRMKPPEYDQDSGVGGLSPLTNSSRTLSVLSDISYDVLSTGSYGGVGARHQSQRDNNQQRQRSPTDSSSPSDRHASFTSDSSRQRHSETDSISSRLERPPIANIAHRQTSAEAAKGRREEGTLRPQGVDFFVPDEDVDLKVLATYLKEYVDPEASIERSKHPKVSLWTHGMRQKTKSSRTQSALVISCTPRVP